MTVVVPPQAAERVAVKKSSAVMTPIEERCSMWQWLSTPPGVTMRPSALISRRPRSSFAPIVAIRPSMTPMSARKTSDAVATVPLRTTRSYSAMILDLRFLGPDPRVLGDGEPAAATFSQPRLETGKQPVELGHILSIELRTRRANRGRADGAAPTENLLAHGKPESRLLLVTDKRQIGVEQIFRLFAA